MSELDPSTRNTVDACNRALPPTPKTGRVAFGFDGMVDNIREMVDDRSSPTEYTAIRSLRELGEQILRSAEERNSLSIEWHLEQTKGGGHACHLPKAFAELGFDPVAIGTFGDPVERCFREELDACELVSIGEPGYVEAVEFDDGKALINQPGDYVCHDWETIRERVGVDRLAEHVDGTELLGMGYWAVIPEFPAIVEGVRSDLLPILSDPPEFIIVDPSDVRQIAPDQLDEGVTAIGRLNDAVPVVFTANKMETKTLYEAIVARRLPGSLAEVAAELRSEIGVKKFVVHAADRAVCAADGLTSDVSVPRTDSPVLTTSAGDHFAVGLGTAFLQGLDDGAALVLANSVAGFFVRNGTPPTYDQATEFAASYAELF